MMFLVVCCFFNIFHDFFIIFHDLFWVSGGAMGLRGPWASGPIGPMGRGSLGAHSGAQGSQGGIPGSQLLTGEVGDHGHRL